MREGRVGAVVEDEGIWCDLGARGPYLEAHRDLGDSAFPQYANNGDRVAFTRIDDEAQIDPTSVIDGSSIVGAGAVVGAGAKITESILWPQAKVAPGANLYRCVVRDGEQATGELDSVDV